MPGLNEQKRFIENFDGAAEHQSKSTENWLLDHDIREYTNGEGLFNSPDGNVIEKVWLQTVSRLPHKVYTNGNSLRKFVQDAFPGIPQEQVFNLYNSHPGRMPGGINGKGGNTRY